MKTAVSALSLLIAIGSGPVMADCSHDTNNPGYVQLDQAGVTALVVGKTACYPVGGPPWENQEYLAGGTITDYKKGPSDPVDPQKVVGGYTINGDGSVTYTYGTAPSFTYVVWGPSDTGAVGLYDFCNTGTQAFLPSQVSMIAGGPRPCAAPPG
jgi:hypothetical protein